MLLGALDGSCGFQTPGRAGSAGGLQTHVREQTPASCGQNGYCRCVHKQACGRGLLASHPEERGR